MHISDPYIHMILIIDLAHYCADVSISIEYKNVTSFCGAKSPFPRFFFISMLLC